MSSLPFLAGTSHYLLLGLGIAGKAKLVLLVLCSFQKSVGLFKIKRSADGRWWILYEASLASLSRVVCMPLTMDGCAYLRTPRNRVRIISCLSREAFRLSQTKGWFFSSSFRKQALFSKQIRTGNPVENFLGLKATNQNASLFLVPHNKTAQPRPFRGVQSLESYVGGRNGLPAIPKYGILKHSTARILNVRFSRCLVKTVVDSCRLRTTK